MYKKILEPADSFVMQLEPESHPVAIKMYKDGCANNWMPSEVKSMVTDIKQWQTNQLNDEEKLLVKRTLGLFAGTESLVASNLLFSVFQYLEDPCLRQYLLRQIFEESLHNLTVKVCCESYQLSRTEVYSAHKSIQSVAEIDNFFMKATKDSRDLDISKLEDKRKFVKLLFLFYILCEGTLFYSNFAALLSLKRRGLMPGLGEQIELTLRDENLHVQFGTYLINTLKKEYPEIFSEEFKEELVGLLKEAVELEKKYSKEILPNGILGMNSDMFHNFTEYMADRRLADLGLNSVYNRPNNPFPWMSEVVGLSKQKNFFETTVTEYQHSGSLDWDDF